MTPLLLLGLTVGALSWEAPIEYVLEAGQTVADPLPRCVDVDPANPTDRCLDKFRIFHGMEIEISEGVMGYVFDQPVIEVDETVLNYVVEPTVEGKYFFAVSAVDREGAESELSNTVSKLITDGALLPPVMLVEERAVFTVKMQPDVFLLFNVGIVPAGTECFLDRGAPTGYGVVPNDEVIWTDPLGPKPIAVVTLCE